MSKCKSKNSCELWSTAELCTVVQTWLHQYCIEWVTSLCSPRSCWIFSVMRAHCCHPPGSSDPSLQSCFPASRPQHITGNNEVIPTQVQNLAFCLHWTSQGFPSSLFSNLVICFWMAAQSSGVAATPLSFVSDANLLSAAQCPITRSGTKMFNNTEHNSNPSRILLVPELQLDVMLLTTTLRPSRSDSFQPMSPLFYFIHTLKDWVWVDYGIQSKVSHKVKINDTCCSSFIPHGHHISP